MGILSRRNHAEPSHDADPDALLVAWAKQHPQAFTALYDRYIAAVYGYCLSQLGDPDTAEDATSLTFLKALASLPGHRDSGRFRSWLFAIAHNAILDAIRGQRTDEPLEAAAEIHDSAITPEVRAIAAFDRAWLDEVIALLPAAERQILDLRHAGLSGTEIAVVLGISHEAAKKRQLRAMDVMRAEAVVTPGKGGLLRGA